MKKSLIPLASLLAATIAVVGCSKSDNTAPETKPDDVATTATATPAATTTPPAAQPGEVAVDELEALMAEDKVSVFDANGDNVRTKFGKIPGAKLLSGHDWSTDELPSDKEAKLVFYCSNTKCGAAPKAAKKAIIAGYADVSVLPVGIMGWKEAGKNTETVQ